MLLNTKFGKFDFTTFEKEDDIGRTVKVIMHDSLQNIIHNEVPNVHYHLDIIAAGIDHSVVKCVMCVDGRHVEEIGESLSATLTNEISQNHPTLIASQRAFDRAAIRFLGLEGKVFSNLEIPVSDDVDAKKEESATPIAKPTTPVKPAAPAAGGIVSTVIDDPVEDPMGIDDYYDDDLPAMIIDDDNEVIDDEVIVDEPITEDVVVEDEVIFDDDVLPVDMNNPGDVMVSLPGSRYPSGLTLQQMYDMNPTTLFWWGSSKFTAYKPEHIQDKQAVITFLNADPDRAAKFQEYLKA